MKNKIISREVYGREILPSKRNCSTQNDGKGMDRRIMETIGNGWTQFLGLLRTFQITDLMDILMVSYLIYKGIQLLKETKASQLIKGLVVLALVVGFVKLFHLKMMDYLLSNILQIVKYVDISGVAVFNLRIEQSICHFTPPLCRKPTEKKKLTSSGIEHGILLHFGFRQLSFFLFGYRS